VRTGNQSLLGVLARLPWICLGNQAIVSMDNLHRLLNIYPEIVAALTAVIFTCLFFIKLNPLRDTAVLLVWMTLAAPRAWTFNFCVELLPAVYLATVIADRRQQSWLAIAALVCIPIAIVFPTNSLSFGDRWALWSYLLQNKHFIAAAIVALAVVKIPGKTVIPPRCPVELPARVPLENIG
jgi:hypothetical protein